MNVTRREFIVAGAAGVVGAVGGVGCIKKPTVLPHRRLSVEFLGLCGVVVAQSEGHVLMVDGVGTLGPGHLHEATLRADPDIVMKESDDADGEVVIGPGTKRKFWNLKDYQLTVVSDGPSGLSSLTGIRNPTDKTPRSDLNSQADAGWLAGLDRIAAAGGGRINPNCLQLDPTPAKVVSRVSFGRGMVTSRFRAPFNKVVWRIASPGQTAPVFEQAIGELRLAQALTADTSTVTIKLEPFPGKSVTAKKIVLKTLPLETKVEIRNVPATKVVCDSPEDTEEARNLHHFAAYYQLLATPVAGTVPIPVCSAPCDEVKCVSLEGEPIYCPPARFLP